MIWQRICDRCKMSISFHMHAPLYTCSRWLTDFTIIHLRHNSNRVTPSICSNGYHQLLGFETIWLSWDNPDNHTVSVFNRDSSGFTYSKVTREWPCCMWINIATQYLNQILAVIKGINIYSFQLEIRSKRLTANYRKLAYFTGYWIEAGEQPLEI